MIKSIWAMDVNWLIGKDNELPWHYKEDLAFFKEKTQGKTVLMGDATYRSLKSYYKTKPLPYGKIYVANLVDEVYPDATLVKDVVDFVKNFKDELWIIGGKMIYQLTLPYADILYITHVLNFHEGNVYFTKFNLSDYKLVEKRMSNGLIFATYKK
ncbi:dihydrofolate reductase [Acholeplasma hippikon]|uniref:dihydrofolate reductase n=1 Tax=Acholeplasma hippikon TaxID=264636 RepID=A0A449BIZ1_9MOLU|nr:dihydrofolate reductase [Acholeplasma hippikon]VEU82373.1 Dihydrofolate reductase [Acholeplasma hippikon]